MTKNVNHVQSNDFLENVEKEKKELLDRFDKEKQELMKQIGELLTKVGNNNTIAGGRLIREPVCDNNFINHSNGHPKLVKRNKGHYAITDKKD